MRKIWNFLFVLGLIWMRLKYVLYLDMGIVSVLNRSWLVIKYVEECSPWKNQRVFAIVSHFCTKISLFILLQNCICILTTQVISQLRILSRSVTAGCKFDREIWSTELSPVLNLWKKLNQVGKQLIWKDNFFPSVTTLKVRSK